MRSFVLRWLVLAFTCAWFGVLAPVHQRGMVQLPGSCDAGAAKACCATTKKTDAPLARTTGNCAVCHLIATLDLPPITDFSLGALQLLKTIDAPAPLSAVVRLHRPPFYSHAPPTA